MGCYYIWRVILDYDQDCSYNDDLVREAWPATFSIDNYFSCN